MSDVVNLRRERKRRAQAQAAQKAHEKRHFYGRSRAEKTVQALEKARAFKDMEGKKINGSEPSTS